MHNPPVILFVDDDPKAGELMARFTEEAEFECRVYQEPLAALEYFKQHPVQLIVSDLRMPDMSGTELLQAVREQDSHIPFIIITGYANVDNAIEAMRHGATDFIKKPYDMDELQLLIERNLKLDALRQENQLLKRQLSDERNRFGMVGHADPIVEIYKIISKIADIRCNVVIEGESGTGKELAARAIHYQSEYADQPFVVIDCGALTDTLLENELFGHEKGAFTGAHQSKRGLLEMATGGTVFLDEIGNITDAMQIKLMRAIQEQQITRVGGLQPTPIDVRFIVATNQDIDQLVSEGKFRHDLYHRLNVVKFRMPPLRQRRDDIPLLVRHFIDHYAKLYGREVREFDRESMQKLMEHDWPGNVRELQNLVERTIALADSPVLHLDDIDSIRSGGGIDSDLPSLAELEKRYIYKILDRFNGSRDKTAETLGINKSTLWRKLQSYKQEDGSE
ncbi:sigma-54 dependent transcriptional regulator [Thiohalophilus sp.]|uniref:sigma-54-dependent transcriptional regulator n=1 Tax=Thiohalophilus sp. TaxID=3028392 RepID=UPI002ACDA3DD|nr:sigma-54 dependent transcriptional regulator [Thiohalophilus sp.]MDZ7661634.1 sigma-54 dependent transcriptional regulator [Thiohalophilus sp.]